MRMDARDVTVRVGSATLLDGVSAHVEPGEVLSIVGPNGAGKSTLLSALTGRKSFEGTIEIGGRSLESWSIDELARRRAVLAQSVRMPFGFRVDETVALGTMPWTKTDEPVPRECVPRCLESVGMSSFANRELTTLSGGESRRVHLARTLAQIKWPTESAAGRLLLLDEPLSSLDIAESTRVLSLVREISRAGVGVVCVLHDLSSAALVSDRVLLLRGGRTVASGPTAEVMTPDILSTCFGTSVDVTVGREGQTLIHSKDPFQNRGQRGNA